MGLNTLWIARLGFVGGIFLGFAVAPVCAEQPGGQLYKTKCAACHGPDGTGSAVGKKLGAHDFASAEVQSLSDQELIETTTKGKDKMPGYGKSLNEAQIKDLVAYIRELGKKK